MDLYQILGVDRTATAAEIKAAYRRLAKGNHPDLIGGDGHARMAEINRAHDVLSDPERRAQYDRTGSDKPIANHGQIAEQRLMAMFNEYLDADREYAGDAIQVMKAAVQRGMADLKSQEATLRRKIVTLERRAKRIKGPPVVHQVANSKIQSCQRALAQLHDELLVAGEVFVLLGAYADGEPLVEQTFTWITING